MSAITPLPTPPNRTDQPALFNSRAQAMNEALVNMVAEINALFGSGGLDQLALLTTTSWGRDLLTLANANATRTAIDAQQSNDNLSAIAAATPIADGAHAVGGVTIETVGGIITAIY